MIKYFCDRCGDEISFDDVIKVEMNYLREWVTLGDSLKFNNSVLCPKCNAEFNKFMHEGKKL